MPNLRTPLFVPAAIFFAAVVAFVSAVPTPASGQNPPDPTVISELSEPQPYLDRKVGSTLEGVSRWQGRMKNEHLTAYLIAYSGLLAGITGLLFGLAAYRMSDPMSPYRLVKRRTFQLAMAIGGSLGILVAVMQVPPNAPGRLSLLLAATLAGAMSTLLAAWLAFQIMRNRSNRAARKDGRRLTDRMRQA